MEPNLNCDGESQKFRLKVSSQVKEEIEDGDFPVAYLYLPGHSGKVPGCVAKTIRLSEFVNYSGRPDINLDFDENNHLIGIEFT